MKFSSIIGQYHSEGFTLHANERKGLGILFGLLWIYLFLRAYSVPLIHDEVVSKWAYMVAWHPFPFSGYIDANNHFLNSFLGGLFIRLFHSDAMWVVRLPNVLAFALYAYGVYALRKFFKSRWGFYACVVMLIGSPFVLEFFALARGYGLALAFLMLSVLQLHRLYAFSARLKNVCLLALSMFFAVYANLSLLPLVLFMVLLTVVPLVKQKRYTCFWPLFLLLAPLAYALHYALVLKDMGKLYYGGQEGLVDNTILSLTPYVYGSQSQWLAWFLVAVGLAILGFLAFKIYRQKQVFETQMLWGYLFAAALFSILAQHYLLGVNFPEDRAALPLLIPFMGAFAKVLDALSWKRVAQIMALFHVVFFMMNINLNHAMFFYYEHFSPVLAKDIAETVKGTKVTTGGRFWKMDNAQAQQANMPMYAFQLANNPYDTLLDFVVSTDVIRPDLPQRYSQIAKDPISGLQLFKRKRFLPRTKFEERTINVEAKHDEFIGLYEGDMPGHVLIEIKGRVEDVDIFTPLFVGFDGSTQGENLFLEAVSLTESIPINKGRMEVHFSFVLPKRSPQQIMKIYLWNPDKKSFSAQLNAQLYALGD